MLFVVAALLYNGKKSLIKKNSKYLEDNANVTRRSCTCCSSFDMCWLIDVWRALEEDANSFGKLSSFCI